MTWADSRDSNSRRFINMYEIENVYLKDVKKAAEVRKQERKEEKEERKRS